MAKKPNCITLSWSQDDKLQEDTILQVFFGKGIRRRPTSYIISDILEDIDAKEITLKRID